jgi:hypothetical protein
VLRYIPRPRDGYILDKFPALTGQRFATCEILLLMFDLPHLTTGAAPSL